MADEDSIKSAKSKFKSKWHRVFKEKEESEITPQHTNSFKLNDDLNEFLKPSIENAASTRPEPVVPKLDVAIAQRWPTAHEVRTASGGVSTPNGFTKPKRRKGLVVAFVRTEPEIIGEGGDESEEPVSEVARRKAITAVAAAERRPRAVTYGAPLPTSQNRPPLQGQPPPRTPPEASNQSPQSQHSLQSLNSLQSDQPLQLAHQDSISNESEDGFDPPPLRRVQTTPRDYSPTIQRKEVAPTVDERPPQLPRLSRTPTGASSDSEFGFGSFRFDHDEPSVPRIDTTFVEQNSNRLPPPPFVYSDIPSASPRDPSTLAARKRELASGEGMILRRASAMIKDRDEDEAQKRESLAMGVQLSAQHYDTLSRPDAPSLMPEVPTPRSALTPKSALSPSPFADPKYLKRHSHDATSEEADFAAPQPSQPQKPKDAPSRLSVTQPPSSLSETTANWSPVPQVQPPRTSDENQAPPRTFEQHARLQKKPAQQFPRPQPPPIATGPPTQQPAPISTVSPPELTYQRPSIGEDELTNMRIASTSPGMPREKVPSSSESSPHRPSPSGSSKYFVKSEDSPRSRDHSPMQSTGADRSQPLYTRANGSSSNLNFAPPAPGYVHSRSSSRDSIPPATQLSAGPGMPRTTVARTQGHTSTPHDNSPRSSMYGSGTTLSPQDYTVPPRPAPYSVPRSPLQYVHHDDTSSRPSSNGSNLSTRQPSPSTTFSGLRANQTEQRQQARWSGVFLQQDSARPSSVDSDGSDRRIPRSTDPIPVLKAPQAPPESNQRPQGAPRSVSSNTAASVQRPGISPQPSSEGNPAADAAYADFAARVAHMKGVFRLTAEKERPSDRCPPLAWLRTALWWYLSGKAGLEILLRLRQRNNDGQFRELLTQPHVDLAKTWWILSDPLAAYDTLLDRAPDSASPSSGSPDAMLRQSITALKSYMKSLCFSMSRSQLMPPPQSLIQGQDTVVWLEYPRFPPDATAVLSGQSQPPMLPLDALPLGDDRETFCYGRFPVDVSLNADDPSTDRLAITCTLSMLRGKRDFGTTIVVASQNELVNIKVCPWQGKGENLTWYDVSWKSNPYGMVIQLHRNFEVTVRMQEKDFRSLWNLLKYAEKIEDNLRPDHGERLIYEAPVAESQYADSSNVNAFPSGKVRDAKVLVFERTVQVADGGGDRKFHRGYRITLVTGPRSKSLACVSNEIGRRSPIYFEFITDSAANGMVAMVIRIREDARQCRTLLVFPDTASRQNFLDVLSGVMVGPHEVIVGKMALAGMNIEPATAAKSVMQEVHPALRALQWQRLGVTNAVVGDSGDRGASTVLSESLRVVARHTTGCITDRLNLGKGEMLLRLPCADLPAMQILRQPQEDIGMSIDTRNSDPSVSDGITALSQTIRQQSTIRTYSFTSYDDLHAFQTAITGCSVRYDGLAATFSIARRRAVVPIYKKWEAYKVRLQIVSYDTVVHILAFMEDFSHTDAMCFQVKSTDTFENGKEHGKGKKSTVKLVDAKFSLPRIPENHNEEGAAAEDATARVKRRFVNLESLEYAEEHDDITVGFETQEDRDKFAQALPAATTVGRGITLKRRT